MRQNCQNKPQKLTFAEYIHCLVDLTICRGVKLIFTEGHIRLMAALKGPVVTNTV